MEQSVNPTMPPGDMSLLVKLLNEFRLMEQQREYERSRFTRFAVDMINLVLSKHANPKSFDYGMEMRQNAELDNLVKPLMPHTGGMVMPEEREDESKNLPKELKSMLGKYRDAGILDESFQPVRLSMTEKATLGSVISKKLWGKNNWKIFEKLWKVSKLSSFYNKALDQKKFSKVIDRFKEVIVG